VQAYRAYNNRTKPEKERERKRDMNLETLKELYVNELRICTMPRTNYQSIAEDGERASSDELKEAFEKHLEQTKGHVQRLEQVFEELGEKIKGKTCQAMKGLIEEGSDVLKADGEESVLDAAIIVGCAKGRALRDRQLRQCAHLRATAWTGQICGAPATNFG
jgi:ferritin-like metal-binding protein YciE